MDWRGKSLDSSEFVKEQQGIKRCRADEERQRERSARTRSKKSDNGSVKLKRNNARERDGSEGKISEEETRARNEET